MTIWPNWSTVHKKFRVPNWRMFSTTWAACLCPPLLLCQINCRSIDGTTSSHLIADFSIFKTLQTISLLCSACRINNYARLFRKSVFCIAYCKTMSIKKRWKISLAVSVFPARYVSKYVQNKLSYSLKDTLKSIAINKLHLAEFVYMSLISILWLNLNFGNFSKPIIF